MTWKIKAKYTAELLFDDPKLAIFKADEWRSQGAEEVWIEDENGNRIDEAMLRKAADQIH